MSRVAAISLGRSAAVSFGGFTSFTASPVAGALPVRVATPQERTDTSALKNKEGRVYFKEESKGASLTLNLVDVEKEQSSSLRFEAPALAQVSRANPGGMVSTLLQGRSASSFELKGSRLSALMDELGIVWDRKGVGVKEEMAAPPAAATGTPGSPGRPGSPGAQVRSRLNLMT